MVVKADKEYEIPFAEAFLKNVDLGQKRIVMSLPEGLLELSAPLTAEEKEQQKRSGQRSGLMKIEIITIFPEFFRGPLDFGIIRRAREAGLATIAVHDLRAFAHDRHRTVDDRPFGGGEGMVLKPEPIFECIEEMRVSPREQRDTAKERVILLSAQGKRFNQAVAV